MPRPSSPLQSILITFVGVLLLSVGFTGGLVAAPLLNSGLAPVAFAQQSQPADFQLFWQAWSLVERHFVDRPVLESREITYHAIQGMLDGLGDEGHTRFLTPDQRQAERTSIQGRFEGIGAEVGMRDGRVTIVAPLDGSPAQNAGLRAGDIIVRVDGEDTSAMRLEEVVQKVRGPAGSVVSLIILRPGETQFREIRITRAPVQIRNVRWAMLPDAGIAYVRITQFADGVTEDLRQALTAATAQGARGVVLDLRNNPGGLLGQAVGVASQFLDGGNVLLEEDRDGNRRPFAVRSGGAWQNGGLVVLINRGSASGAEVVAGALQDHRRATLLGERTFGTGTVLGQFQLDDGSALYLAIANWLTPEGRRIKTDGIAPDEVLPLPLNVVPASPQAAASGDPEASQDVQLQRAVQILLEEARGGR